MTTIIKISLSLRFPSPYSSSLFPLPSTTLFPLLSSTLLAFCSKCGAVGCNASTLVYSAIRRVLAFLAVWFRRNIAQR